LIREVTDHAVALVRDDNRMLLLHRGEPTPFLVVIFVSYAHDDGRVLEREIRSRIQGATVIYVDRRSAAVGMRLSSWQPAATLRSSMRRCSLIH
jgi:beta-N-acetylhexosaminidase